MTHRCQFRVYYEDTDAGGVVYYANYLKFAERARTEALRALGIDQSALWENEKTGFAVRRIEAEYLRPARLDDLLEVHTTLTELGKASLHMQQSIVAGSETLFTLVVKLGVISNEFKPARLPQPVHNLMQKLLA